MRGAQLNQRKKRENHEFLNPIVGFRAAQAAAVAAGFSNAVIEATCRVGVRPCRPHACVCVSVKEREIDWCLGYHIHPQAAQLNWATAGCFYKEPLVFWSPPVCCLHVCEAYLLGGRSKRANWTRAFDLNHILLKKSQTFGCD